MELRPCSEGDYCSSPVVTSAAKIGQHTRAERQTVGTQRIISGVKVSECHFEDLADHPALLKTLDLCDARLLCLNINLSRVPLPLSSSLQKRSTLCQYAVRVHAEYLQVGNRSIRRVATRSNVKCFKKSGPVCNKMLQRHIPERDHGRERELF